MADAIQVGFGPLKVTITELGKEFELLRVRVKHIQQIDAARAKLRAHMAAGAEEEAADMIAVLSEAVRLVVPALTDEDLQEVEVDTIHTLLALACQDAEELRARLKGEAPETTAPGSS
jgi:hypothetical protein